MLVQPVLVHCLAAGPFRWLADHPDHVLARARREMGSKATERGV